MKYIEIEFRDQKWTAQIDSKGYSLLFLARLLKSDDQEITSIELRGSDLITKEKINWFKFEDVRPNEQVQLNFLDSKFDNNENPINDQLIRTPNQKYSTSEDSEYLYQVSRKPNSINLDLKNQIFNGTIDSNSYHIVFMLSIKVYADEEQVTLHFYGEDLEKNTTQNWINEEVKSYENINLRFISN